MRQKNRNVVYMHCMIHREELSAKSLPKDLHDVMTQVASL